MIPDEAVEASDAIDYFANMAALTSDLDGAEVINGFLDGLREARK